MVNDLDVSQGNIDPTTGRAIHAVGNPDTLLATTYGRGSFAIRLSPVIVPGSLILDPADDSRRNAKVPNDNISNVLQPHFTGLSEQTAYGQKVRVTLVDDTDVNNPVYIGGFDGTFGDATDIATNWTDTAGNFRLQVNAGVWSNSGANDGKHVIGVYATDNAGVKGAIGTVVYTLDTQVLPPTLILNPASDSAVVGDNITNDNTPTVNGAVEANASVQILVNGKAAGTTLAGGTGNYTFTLGVLTDGKHAVTAIQTDVAGNVSAVSATLNLVIDTVVATPAAPTLTVATDSGIKGDNITNFNAATVAKRPAFTGTVEPGATVQIFVNGTAAASGVADAVTGIYTIPLTSALADGTWSITARQTDVAGNVSATSAATAVQIDTVALAPTPPDLDASTDSGVSSTDNLTNSTTWLLLGTVEAGASVQIFGDGSALGSPGTADSKGAYAITVPALTDGAHNITAVQTDVAGNVSVASAPALVITEDRTNPAVTGVNSNFVATQAATVAVAHYTDLHPLGSASINWGDGSTSPGTIVANPGGGYDVRGTHTYLLSGRYTVTVIVTDEANNSSAAATSTAKVVPGVLTAPDLDASTDSGISNTDNLTKSPTWLLTGSGAEPNITVRIYANGALLGSARPTPRATMPSPSTPRRMGPTT